MVFGISRSSRIQNFRILVAIILTAICIFMVMWQRESTDILLSADNRLNENSWIPDRFFLKDEYVRQRDLNQLEANWEVRHKFRWAYKSVEVEIYKAVHSNFPIKYLRYVALLHYVGIIFITYLICLLILRQEIGRLNLSRVLVSSLAFIGYISSIFHVAGWQEDYSAIEMLAIALAIHAGQKGSKWLFLVAVFLAISNRESGFAVALIYPLINSERLRNWFFPIIAATVLFCALNFDLLVQPKLYQLGNFVVTGGSGYPTILNFFEFPVGKWGSALLSYLAFVGPILLLASECWQTINGRRYFGIVAIYLIIFLFGSSLTNAFLFLMLLPIYFLITGYALSNSGRSRLKDPL
jgi:hypothetical protein